MLIWRTLSGAAGRPKTICYNRRAGQHYQSRRNDGCGEIRRKQAPWTLESRYDLKLLQRNASKPSVTRDGMAFYQRALHVLREFSEFQAEFSDHKSNLNGPLRITVPHDFGQYYLNNVLERFQGKYPNIHLTVNFLDRSVDLVHENYDFALRIAPEMDENLKGEQLAEITHSLVASPRYLADFQSHLGLRRCRSAHFALWIRA